MPARIRSRNTASELLAGPIVQTIFALRAVLEMFNEWSRDALANRLYLLFLFGSGSVLETDPLAVSASSDSRANRGAIDAPGFGAVGCNRGPLGRRSFLFLAAGLRRLRIPLRVQLR